MQVTHEIDEHLQKVRVGEFDSLVMSKASKNAPKPQPDTSTLATLL
jgi:hypothetical protein